MSSPESTGDEAILSEISELSRGLSDEWARSAVASVIDLVALNPQPLPPKTRQILESVIDAVALNPQPLPPKAADALRAIVSLNPQPEPPGASAGE